MNQSRNNEHGFSLVEFIVVILIMSVIAVALAPQVIKYVNTASVNTDLNNAANIRSAALAGGAHYVATGHEIATTVAITLEQGKVLDSAPTAGSLEEAIYSDIGVSTTEPAPVIQSDSEMKYWIIEVNDQGHAVSVVASKDQAGTHKSTTIVA